MTTAVSRGYSHFVKGARIALPLVALMLLGFVLTRLFFPDTGPERLTPVDTVRSAPRPDAGAQGVTTARFEGLTRDNKPYTLLAEKAERTPDNPNRVLLTKPKADMLLADNRWLAVHAARGSYDTQQNILQLEGGLEVFHDQGLSAQLTSATLDFGQSRMTSAQPVVVQAPQVYLLASGLRVDENATLITFTGPVIATVFPPRRG